MRKPEFSEQLPERFPEFMGTHMKDFHVPLHSQSVFYPELGRSPRARLSLSAKKSSSGAGWCMVSFSQQCAMLRLSCRLGAVNGRIRATGESGPILGMPPLLATEGTVSEIEPTASSGGEQMLCNVQDKRNKATRKRERRPLLGSRKGTYQKTAKF